MTFRNKSERRRNPLAAKWAPADLVELQARGEREKSPNSGVDLDRKTGAHGLLTKFITDERMALVWNALEYRWKQRRASDGEAFFCGAPLLAICQRHLTDWLRIPEETVARRSARLRKISRDGADLEKQIVASGHFREYTAERFMDDAEIISLWDVLQPNPVPRKGRGVLRRWDEGLRIVWLRTMLRGSLPKLTRELRQMSEQALIMTTTRERFIQPGSGRSGRDYKARHLALTLCNYLRREYGRPLHSIVASITEVVTEVRLDVHAIIELERTRNARLAVKKKAKPR